MNHEKLLNLKEFINQAKKEGIDFGKGKPYNRLRYYTKMKWIPNMTRKGTNAEGHYPVWVIKRLKLIQSLKSQGLSNEEITQTLEKKKKIRRLADFLKTPNLKKKIFVGLATAIIGLIILSELDIIRIGRSKREISPQRGPKTVVFP